jgi:lambda repressor-like predicted transcriptional regulator
MDSGNGVRDALVMALHVQGYSIRAISREVGLSRSRVHQIIAASTAEAEERLAELDAEDSDELVPPFRFVGMDPPEGGRRAVERFVDGNGIPCNVLGIWRADRDPDCPSASLGYLADATRQVEAAGYRRVSAGDGYWHWERAAAS